jgi:hypothetical protein
MNPSAWFNFFLQVNSAGVVLEEIKIASVPVRRPRPPVALKQRYDVCGTQRAIVGDATGRG